MKKMGRPIIGDPLKTEIKVRIDEKTEKRLEAFCKLNRITKSQAVRDILDSYLKAMKVLEEK